MRRELDSYEYAYLREIGVAAARGDNDKARELTVALSQYRALNIGVSTSPDYDVEREYEYKIKAAVARDDNDKARELSVALNQYLTLYKAK